ncbi:dihydrolipoyl dehydrogenase family protein [Natronobiforma cellulositropha]|uniref:dihydrolipoyl dehydrogenase family protein n=1 Tax=Natronobiforma cellulositropha TaxID=1679076 RepID=UPI0021D5A899|nr:dihydrolipoyl dehydrogenase [Natronobiforma cellulositropha]
MTTNEFDVVVLGGGSGSQIASAAAAEGLEAAVLEPGPLGGACITRGCVPSKALVQRADLLEEIRRAGRFGIDATVEGIDFGAITETIESTVYEKADRQRGTLEGTAGLTLYEAVGRFVDERTIALERDEGESSGHDSTDRNDAPGRIRGDHVVIAVGGRPVVPPIDGLEDVPYLTSDDALFLEERPETLVIVGGGYIGVELCHVFAAVGTDVTLVGRSESLLPDADADVSEAVTEALAARTDCYTGHEVTAVSSRNGGVRVTAESGDGETVDLDGDELLVATGREPNTDALGLERAGVETDERGHVAVDECLETTSENVWALGDVLAAHPYKHAADYEARVVTRNLLERALGRGEREDRGETDERGETDGPVTVEYDTVAHAVFTHPQVASVGQTEDALEEAGRAYEATTVPYDVAPLGMLLDLDEAAFVKVLASPDGEVLGCHVVGPQASTLIHEVVVAMETGPGTLEALADVVHVHPALSEVLLVAFDEAAGRPHSTAPDWRGLREGM